jgi:hypothetical protein
MATISNDKNWRFPDYTDSPDIPRDISYLAADISEYIDNHPGPTGATGATGATGPSNVLSVGTVTTGNAGSSASVTIAGTSPSQTISFTIPRGDTGATGLTGEQGIQGVQGIQGEQGIQGLKGDKGDTGETGATGATGATGPQGEQGIQGIQGIQGEVGATGATGATGAAGQDLVSVFTIAQKYSSYTLVSSDLGKLIEMSSGGTVTIPTDSEIFAIGSTVDIVQTGSSQVTIAADTGVTVNSTPGLKLRAQWSSATLIKRGNNLWVALGDLSA